MELLEVDESRLLVPLLRQQIELIKQRRAVKNPADAPHHALADHAATDAEPVPVLKGALGKADRTRPLTDPVGIVEQYDRQTARRQQLPRDIAPPQYRSDPDRRGGNSRTGIWTAAPCAQPALAKGPRPY